MCGSVWDFSNYCMIKVIYDSILFSRPLEISFFFPSSFYVVPGSWSHAGCVFLPYWCIHECLTDWCDCRSLQCNQSSCFRSACKFLSISIAFDHFNKSVSKSTLEFIIIQLLSTLVLYIGIHIWLSKWRKKTQYGFELISCSSFLDGVNLIGAVEP